MISPARVVAAVPEGQGMTLRLEGGPEAVIETALLLVADGAASGLREQLGVAVREKPYRQHALVANVACAQPHKGCAYERFTDQGPVALLPLLASSPGEHRSSLVWTLSPERGPATCRPARPRSFCRHCRTGLATASDGCCRSVSDTATRWR